MKKLVLFILMFCIMILSHDTYAEDATKGQARADNTDIASKVICNIVITLSGPVSQAISTLIIIITGYSFFVGKVSIGMLLIVAAGIMFVFGAQTIMSWILGSEVACEGGDITVTP